MKNKTFILLFLWILIASGPLFAQFEDIKTEQLPNYIGSRVRLQTDSGASFQGTLYSVDEEFITIIDLDGRVVTILHKLLAEAQITAPNLDKKSYYQDSAANRLLVMPTGFPMETGEFHIADQEIAAVTMSYGVNQNLSLWGGISIPGAIVSARYILPIGEKNAVSLGSFAGISWLEFIGVILPYAIYSTGSPENNFTLGAGTAFIFDESSFELGAAVLAIGGKTVLSDTTAIVTENWIIWGKMEDIPTIILDPENEPEDYPTAWDGVPIWAVPGVAFRIAGEKFSWDIGAVMPLIVNKQDGKYNMHGLFSDGGTGGFVPLPLISLTYRID